MEETKIELVESIDFITSVVVSASIQLPILPSSTVFTRTQSQQNLICSETCMKRPSGRPTVCYIRKTFTRSSAIDWYKRAFVHFARPLSIIYAVLCMLHAIYQTIKSLEFIMCERTRSTLIKFTVFVCVCERSAHEIDRLVNRLQCIDGPVSGTCGAHKTFCETINQNENQIQLIRDRYSNPIWIMNGRNAQQWNLIRSEFNYSVSSTPSIRGCLHNNSFAWCQTPPIRPTINRHFSSFQLTGLGCRRRCFCFNVQIPTNEF